MTTTIITLDAIKAAQEQLANMIAAYEATIPRIFAIPRVEIEINSGEHYAGIVLSETGAPSYHLILMSDQARDIQWDKAVEWVASIGGDLPTRSEQALLYANLKNKFDATLYWSREQYAADTSRAWSQDFDGGGQDNDRTSYEGGRARAVRRVLVGTDDAAIAAKGIENDR
jgi:hypothetical protein